MLFKWILVFGWTQISIDLVEAETLNSGGASFAATLYHEWFKQFPRKYGEDIKVTYESIGSTNGKLWIKNQLKSHKNHVPVFAGSDTPFSQEDFERFPELRFFPMVGGAVILAYNLPGVPVLRLKTKILAKIYDGYLKYWNDTELQEANPDVVLPFQEIRQIARADSSGTTEIFTKAMSSVSEKWKAEIGEFKSPDLKSPSGPSANWPENGVEFFGFSTSGVAHLVRAIPYSIAYMSSARAAALNLSIVTVVNEAGDLIHPPNVAESVQTAMDYSVKDITKNNIVTLINAPVKNAYPIALVTYLIVNTTTSENVNCKEMKAFVRIIEWALTDPGAVKLVRKYQLVPLSKNLIKRVKENVLNKITCRGTLVKDLIAEDEKPSFFTATRISFISIALLVLVGIATIFIGKEIIHRQVIMRKDWLIYEPDLAIGLESYDIQPRLNSTPTSRSKIGETSAELSLKQNFVPLSIFYVRKAAMLKQEPIILHQTAACGIQPKRFAFRASKLIYNMNRMSHDNSLKFLGIVVQKDGSVFHAFSLPDVHKGTLYGVLTKLPPKFNVLTKLSFFMDICDGLTCLHKHHVVHGFLDPWNCIVGENWKVQLTNWTQASVAAIQHDFKTLCGSYGAEEFGDPRISQRMVYRHPSFFQEEEACLSFGHDVYSLGILLHTIMIQKAPFPQENLSEIVEFLRKPYVLDVPDGNIPKALEGILHRVIRKKPRMELKEIADMIQFQINSSPFVDTIIKSREDYINSLWDEEVDASVVSTL